MIPSKIGRYEVISELGHGGMAIVYAARDPLLNRDVAIKILPAELLHDPTFRARFEREAKTVAALNHPAIVPVYDYGAAEGQPYFVMRRMAGGSLADRIRKGPLPLPETITILSQLAPALDDAHARGIIHRDLKPGNILFDQYGKAYLSDFGLAKLAQSTQATLTGAAIVGTPVYMSPEQALGESVDNRSDIYALGIILFEMLSGKVPYDGGETPTRQLLRRVTDPVPDIMSVKRDLPYGCQMVIGRAMAKQPRDRYATASELVEALKAITAEEKTALRMQPPQAAVVAEAYPPPDAPMPVNTIVDESYRQPYSVRPVKTVIATQPVEEVLAPGGFPLMEKPRRKIPSWVWFLLAALVVCGAIGLVGGGLGALIYFQPTATPTPRPTLTASATATASPIPTSTSTPLPTSTPTPTPIPPTETATATPLPTLPPALLAIWPNAEIIYHDDFDAIAPEVWKYDASTTQLSDGIVQLTGLDDWRSALRRVRSYSDGEGVLVLLKYQSYEKMEIFFNNGAGWNTPTYRRWGLYFGDNLIANVYEGSKAKGGTFFQGTLASLKSDVWYYVWIAIKGKSGFEVVIWDRDDPTQQCSYEKTFTASGWSGATWWLTMNINTGVAYIDSFTDVRLGEAK